MHSVWLALAISLVIDGNRIVLYWKFYRTIKCSVLAASNYNSYTFSFREASGGGGREAGGCFSISIASKWCAAFAWKLFTTNNSSMRTIWCEIHEIYSIVLPKTKMWINVIEMIDMSANSGAFIWLKISSIDEIANRSETTKIACHLLRSKLSRSEFVDVHTKERIASGWRGRGGWRS